MKYWQTIELMNTQFYVTDTLYQFYLEGKSLSSSKEGEKVKEIIEQEGRDGLCELVRKVTFEIENDHNDDDWAELNFHEVVMNYLELGINKYSLED